MSFWEREREREGGEGGQCECDALDDMDIYSELLILTLNTESHFM